MRVRLRKEWVYLAIMAGVGLAWLASVTFSIRPPVALLVMIFFGLGLWRPGGGLLAFLVSWPFIGLGGFEGQGTFAALSAFAVAGGYGMRSVLIERGQTTRIPRPVFVYFLAVTGLVGLAIVGGSVMDFLDRRAMEFLVLTFSHMLVAVCLAHFAAAKQYRGLILQALVVGAVVAGMIAISGAGFAMEQRLGFDEEGGQLRRLANALSFGIVACLSMIFFPRQVFSIQENITRVILIAALAFLVLVLLLTAARGALLGVFLAAFMGGFVRLYRERARLLSVAGAILSAGVALVVMFLVDLREVIGQWFPVLVGRVGIEALDDSRWRIWQGGFSNADPLLFLFGGGLGGWHGTSGPGLSAHSFFVDWVFTFGVFGAAIGVLFLWGVVIRVYQFREDWLVPWVAFFIGAFSTYGTVQRVTPWLVIGILFSVFLITHAGLSKMKGSNMRLHGRENFATRVQY